MKRNFAFRLATGLSIFSMLGCSTGYQNYKRHIASQDENRVAYASYSEDSKEYAEIHHPKGIDTPILDAYFASIRGLRGRKLVGPQVALLREFRLRPNELFRELRAKAPVLELDALNLYIVTRDEDVRKILARPTTFTVDDYRHRMQPANGSYQLNQDSLRDKPLTENAVEAYTAAERAEEQKDEKRNSVTSFEGQDFYYYNIEEKDWMRSLMNRREDFGRIQKMIKDSTLKAISERSSIQRDGRTGQKTDKAVLEIVSQVNRQVVPEMVRDYFGFKMPLDKLREWSFKTQDSFFHNVGYLNTNLKDWSLSKKKEDLIYKALQITKKKGQHIAKRVHEDGKLAGQEMHQELEKYIWGAPRILPPGRAGGDGGFGGAKSSKPHLQEILDGEDTLLKRILKAQNEGSHPAQRSFSSIAEHESKVLEETYNLSRGSMNNKEAVARARTRSSIVGGLVGAVETSNGAVTHVLNLLLKMRDSKDQKDRDNWAKIEKAARDVGDNPILYSEFAAYVWDVLRRHPIAPFVVRYIPEDNDVKLGGWKGQEEEKRVLKKGYRVLAAIQSAMNDPRTLSKPPEEFHADRHKEDYRMNIGWGLHRCLGDYVAMIMIPEIIKHLILLPDLQRVESDIAVAQENTGFLPEDQKNMSPNQGVFYGRRDSFPERYKIMFNYSEFERSL